MDYYKELNISKDATLSQIKKAYHKLAMENHPDKHPNNKEKEDKFKKISQAYEILSDERKRNQYDMNGKNKSQYIFTNPIDIFEEMNKLFNYNFFGENQSDIMNGLNIFNPMNNSFSQSTVTVIRNGKSYTKTTIIKDGISTTKEEELSLHGNNMGFLM